MSEYYLEYGEIQDLKHFLSIGNDRGIRQILHDVEMRNFRLKLAHRDMQIKAWLNNGGYDA